MQIREREVDFFGQRYVCQLSVFDFLYVSNNPVTFSCARCDSRPDIDHGKFIDALEVVLNIVLRLQIKATILLFIDYKDFLFESHHFHRNVKSDDIARLRVFILYQLHPEVGHEDSKLRTSLLPERIPSRGHYQFTILFYIFPWRL